MCLHLLPEGTLKALQPEGICKGLPPEGFYGPLGALGCPLRSSCFMPDCSRSDWVLEVQFIFQPPGAASGKLLGVLPSFVPII